MNKKGFTLTELMGVLILLSIVIIIGTSSILKARDKANESLDKNTKILISSSAKRYFSEKDPNGTCVNIETLVDEDYLKNPIVNDEKTNSKLLEKSVRITASKGEYTIEDGKCNA